MDFLKRIFIWWHNNTLGAAWTMSKAKAKKVGEDEQGNRYFEEGGKPSTPMGRAAAAAGSPITAMPKAPACRLNGMLGCTTSPICRLAKNRCRRRNSRHPICRT